jgi:chaperonin GroES
MLKPIEDRVVVKPIVEDISTTASGFLISKVDEKPQEAIVVAVGPGITLPSGTHVDLDVKVGDKVVFAKYSGTEVNHNNESYLVLPYRDILAVLEED